MVEKLAWAYAVNANSATVFVRHLLTAVFPMEILLVSNLRGGKRGKGDARLPLDKNKVDAIYSKFSYLYGMCFGNSPCFFVLPDFGRGTLIRVVHHTSILHCQTLVSVVFNCMRRMENISTHHFYIL